MRMQTRAGLLGMLCAAAFIGLDSGCADDAQPGSSRITVIDGETGETLWQRVLPAETIDIDEYAPADEIAVYGINRCTDDFQRAFDAQTGEPRDPPPFEGYSSMFVVDISACEPVLAGRPLEDVLGVVDDACIIEDDEELVALEGSSGRERFRIAAPSGTEVRLFGDHLLLVTSESSPEEDPRTLELYSGVTGERLWTVPLADHRPSSAGDHIVYLHDDDWEILALSLDDGRELWRGDVECEGRQTTRSMLVCSETLRASMCTYEPD